MLGHGDQVFYRHVVSWEVVSPLTASPETIVFRRGQRDFRVQITSRDRKLFRITRAECTMPGVHGRADDPAAALAHTLVIEGVPRSENGRGVVTVSTDHPAQKSLDVSLIALD